jgi:hypothetical protein
MDVTAVPPTVSLASSEVPLPEDLPPLAPSSQVAPVGVDLAREEESAATITPSAAPVEFASAPSDVKAMPLEESGLPEPTSGPSGVQVVVSPASPEVSGAGAAADGSDDVIACAVVPPAAVRVADAPPAVAVAAPPLILDQDETPPTQDEPAPLRGSAEREDEAAPPAAEPHVRQEETAVEEKPAPTSAEVSQPHDPLESVLSPESNSGDLLTAGEPSAAATGDSVPVGPTPVGDSIPS